MSEPVTDGGDATHSFSPAKLNDAFGFATIVACLDSAKHVLAHPLHDINVTAALMLLYFFVFRTKMYIDDAGHPFEARRWVDLWIAVASWIAFLASGAAIEAGVDIAVTWFLLGLLLSTVWIWVNYRRAKADKAELRRYARYFAFNLLHAALLFVYVLLSYEDRQRIAALGLAIVLVFGDIVLGRLLARKGKAKPLPAATPVRASGGAAGAVKATQAHGAGKGEAKPVAVEKATPPTPRPNKA